MVERQARDLDVRGPNPGPGSNFSFELKKNSLRQIAHQHYFAPRLGAKRVILVIKRNKSPHRYHIILKVIGKVFYASSVL